MTPAQARPGTTPMPRTPARANVETVPRAHPPVQAIALSRPVPPSPARATLAANPNGSPPAQAYDLTSIRHLGRLLDDLETLRIMNGNRIGAAERELGDALPHLHYILEPLADAEHRAELELKRAWRKHPLAPWAAGYRGLGEKSIARLIASIGDPAERPNVAKLWAYCGHGDPNRAGHVPKGATQAELFKRGNPRAKKQTWLIATSLLKAGNRDAYDAARLRYQAAKHERPCPRCGPAGHPAPAGSDLSDGHKHARALRALGKSFLVDLWVAARDLHSSVEAQVVVEVAGT